MSRDASPSQGSDNVRYQNQMEWSTYTPGSHGNQLQGDLDSRHMQDDPSLCFHHLMEGIKKLQDERVAFFANLAAVVPKLEESVETSYDNIDVPESPLFWMRVLQHLVTQNEWHGVWYLLCPDKQDQGDKNWSPLHGRARNMTTKDIKVSCLLTKLGDQELTSWGIQLAICLLKNGSAVESIAVDDSEPITIAAVKAAIRTGNMDLLTYILENQPNLILHIDQPDIHGDTPLHLCVKWECLATDNRQTSVLEALVELGCRTSVQDGQHKPAVHYVKPPDPRYSVLEQAARSGGDGLKKRIDEMKRLGDEEFQKDHYVESLRWYKHALSLAESVPNLKLELALLHSACSYVYANLAVIEDGEGVCSATASLNIQDLCTKKNDLKSLLFSMRSPSVSLRNHQEERFYSGQDQSAAICDNCGSVPKDTGTGRLKKPVCVDSGKSQPQEKSAVIDHSSIPTVDEVPEAVIDDEMDGEQNESSAICDTSEDYIDITDEGTLTDSSDCDTVVDMTEHHTGLAETDQKYSGQDRNGNDFKSPKELTDSSDSVRVVDNTKYHTGFTETDQEYSREDSNRNDTESGLECVGMECTPESSESEEADVKQADTVGEMTAKQNDRVEVPEKESETDDFNLVDDTSEKHLDIDELRVLGVDSFSLSVSEESELTICENSFLNMDHNGSASALASEESGASLLCGTSRGLEEELTVGLIPEHHQNTEEETCTSDRSDLYQDKGDDEIENNIVANKRSVTSESKSSNGELSDIIVSQETEQIRQDDHFSKENNILQDEAVECLPTDNSDNGESHSDQGNKISRSGSKSDLKNDDYFKGDQNNFGVIPPLTSAEKCFSDTSAIQHISDDIHMGDEKPEDKETQDLENNLHSNTDIFVKSDQCRSSNANNSARETLTIPDQTAVSTEVENIHLPKGTDTDSCTAVEKSLGKMQGKNKNKNKKSKNKRKPAKPQPIDEQCLEECSKEESKEEEGKQEQEVWKKPVPRKLNKERHLEEAYDSGGAKPKAKQQSVSECKACIQEIIQDMKSLIFSSGRAFPETSIGKQLKAEEAEILDVPTDPEITSTPYADLGNLDDEEDIELNAENFDATTWEVECTAKAWKHLQEHNVPLKLKQKAIKMIENLACGNWNRVIRYEVKGTPKGVFETKLSPAVSLIWERAIAFSGRCSDTPDRRIDDDNVNFVVEGGRIYTEIIRIWGISLSSEEFENLSETIQRSHMRGRNCLMKKTLKRMKSNNDKSDKHIPKQFSESKLSTDRKSILFYPPASPNKTEYHILKFYTFSSALVNIILDNIVWKVDLPFKVTDREHAIIHLQSQAPILLLGRSGTGKTTCCLYRLWTNFISYWVTSQGIPFMPKTDWFFAGASDDPGIEKEETESDSEDTVTEPFSRSSEDAREEEEEEEEEEEDIDYNEYDHLHQIFVTKNPVLCIEVKKNFYELCRAHNETREHAEIATGNLPPKLQEVEDLLFPLFLTSKQLLLMLDASLEPPYFFERNEDGTLNVKIYGWEEKNNVGIPLLDQDLDDEMNGDWYYEEEEGEEDVGAQEAPRLPRQQKLDPRKEVTYNVFAEIIWPKIRKRMSVRYHPSLVWTEIMSFIQGSYEALSKPNGHLSELEYLEVGKKRAPNFSADRDKIYELFKRYDHYKSQNLMFDEADLVFHIFKRLKNMEDLPWILHQLYVDETQDFTQAELSVLLRITQHPNDMFLTGDTAQGIMRGISFRFCDLKSLFYHAKTSLEAHQMRFLNEPKQIYQLTHSYRSHAGILSLASSVLDLMVEFFPESFDRLKKDQGLFDGPSPILLESCSIEDVLILLQGNNRETSHIEFGAHQAILVVNQAAKETLPEILSKHSIVLTIFESKGLEFDDVLLYNFFTDSEANKEWRVVTSFLESLSEKPQEEEDLENLHTIDEAMLRQPNRPRPLSFDPNQHKVLNSELKYLYTALTRARVNVWLFDKDEDKRAPMFEYFKARKLVRCITETEQGVTEFEDMVFAMKSSPEDWVKRGDEMMTQSLYDIAAKCYEMGWNESKECLALAHAQAKKANKMKDTPKKMRDEFIHAALKFFHCGEALKATQCLQNAQAHELAAMSYKRMNKLPEAARMFQRAKKYTAASECYEYLGQYNKAVQVLAKEELYEQAVQCVRRYNQKIQSLTEEGTPVSKVLDDNKPQLTEKDLYLKQVDLCHKQKNKTKMLLALKQLPNDEQLEYLESHLYLDEAADAMLKGGSSSPSDVAEMMLRHGRNEKALEYAKQGEDLEILGKCHHAIALKMYADLEEDSKETTSHKDSGTPSSKVIHHFQHAKEAFKRSGNSNSAGIACYYIAYIKQSLKDAKDAYTFFKNVKPFSNEAGMLDAWNIVVNNIRKDYISDCRTLINVMDTLLNVMYTLLNPCGPEQRNRFKIYMQFYGLHENDEDPNTLRVYPGQSPLCAERDVIPNFYSKKENKEESITRNKQEMSIHISLYLAGILENWVNTCHKWLQKHVSHSLQCRMFKEGRTGEEAKSCGNVNCSLTHEAYTRTTALKALELLFLSVNMDAILQQGIKLVKGIPLKKKDKGDLDNKLSTISEDKNFKSCVRLFRFLIPESHFTRALVESQEFIHNPSFKKVKDHVQDFLEQPLKPSCKERCESTDWIVQMTTYVALFNINRDVKKLCLSIESQLYKDPAMLARERDLAFIVYKSHGSDDIIELFGKIFHESCLLLQEDLEKAIFTYTRYVKILGDRNKLVIFPQLTLFLFWHEVFLSVAFVTLAKLSPSGHCVLPSTYLATLLWIDVRSPKGSKTIQQLINATSKSLNVVRDLVKRMIHFAGILCGYKTRMNLLFHLFQSRKPEEPFPFLLAERCLIQALVLLSNIGMFVPLELETPLKKSIMSLELPENAPKRLKQTLKIVKEAKGISDIVCLLRNLLSQREGENLYMCSWQWDAERQRGIQQQQIKTFDKFTPNFFTDQKEESGLQKDNLEREEVEEVVEEARLTDEEIKKHREEQQKYEQELKENTSARVIQRFFKRVTLTGRIEVGNLKKRCMKQLFIEMFDAYKVTEHGCGICWVDFKPERAENTEIDVTEVPLDEQSTEDPEDKTVEDEVALKSIAETLLNPEKESQTLYETHVATPEHKLNLMNFQLSKNLYEEYFISLVPEIRAFIEELRSQKIFISEAIEHVSRFDYMTFVVEQLYQKVFLENQWHFVYDLRAKLIPLHLYYRKALEDVTVMKNQYLLQQQEMMPQELNHGQVEAITNCQEPVVAVDQKDAVTEQDTDDDSKQDEIVSVEYVPSSNLNNDRPTEGVNVDGHRDHRQYDQHRRGDGRRGNDRHNVDQGMDRGRGRGQNRGGYRGFRRGGGHDRGNYRGHPGGFRRGGREFRRGQGRFGDQQQFQQGIH